MVYFLGVRKKCDISLKSDTIWIALLYDKAQIVMIMLPKLGYIIIIILALLLWSNSSEPSNNWWV